MAKVYTEAQALDRMRALCAKAEHCSGEIAGKLRKMGFAPGVTSRMIASLVADRYIDDARFARAFVRDKVTFARWGRRKIAYAMALKKVPSDIIRDTLDAIDPEEYLESAKKLAASKLKGRENPDYEYKMKIYRWLASRGFESDIISEALRQ